MYSLVSYLVCNSQEQKRVFPRAVARSIHRTLKHKQPSASKPLFCLQKTFSWRPCNSAIKIFFLWLSYCMDKGWTEGRWHVDPLFKCNNTPPSLPNTTVVMHESSSRFFPSLKKTPTLRDDTECWWYSVLSYRRWAHSWVVRVSQIRPSHLLRVWII